MSSISSQFNAAVNIINSLPKEGPLHITIEQKLVFYSLYKIATIGDNTIEKKPPLWRLEERLKWNAWKTRNGLSPEDAKFMYVQEMGNVLKNIHTSGKTEELLKYPDEAFINSFNREDINILLDAAKNDENTSEDMKKILFDISSKMLDN